MRSATAVLRRPVVAGAQLRTALTPSPRLRRRLIVLVGLSASLIALYMLWLRDSSLVAVEKVSVTGLTSRDADRIHAALSSTAKTMTTLHLDEQRLKEAVAVFPVVDAIEITPDFPHDLTIRVIEHRPAAILDAGGARVPVAGDGSILIGMPVEGELPTIDLSGGVPQRQLPAGAARDSALVAGAAPVVIARRLESIGREGGPRGVVVQVADGPEIVFGTTARVKAKWAATVRVLADEEAAGAAYIDVRIPERPVAGGVAVETVAPVAPVTDPALDPTLEQADPSVAAPSDPLSDPAVEEVAPPSETPAPTPEEPAPVAPAEPTGGATL